MLSGYVGKIGWVDLTKGSIKIDELEEAVARKYLGGKGLGCHFLHRYQKPKTDPFDRQNILVFITGPLTGTGFPATSRSGVITRSPLSGTFLDSYSGGFFGSQLKWAGFDVLVISGMAMDPAYLLVENGKISIQKAGSLWGLSTFECERHLRDVHMKKGRKEISVAAIGKAGENRVRYASIINERRAHGRGGAGAVMGSKNLKAIVVMGDGKVPLANEGRFKEVMIRCQQKIRQDPTIGKGGVVPRMGTMLTVDVTQETGTLPTRNWQENTFEYSDKINGEAFLNYSVRRRTCFACPIGCSRETKVTKMGEEYITEGPDYETIYAFGPNCGINDPEIIIAADRLCDDYGMDTISCGVTIGFAMECFEKGLIGKKETGGIDLTFGNGVSLLQVIPLIAKKEGIGELLSEGVKRASEKIGGSSEFALHVKGLELPGYDPRGMTGQGLTYALADRGGCHVRSNTLRTELLELPDSTDRYAYAWKPQMVRALQLRNALSDCMIACKFGSFALTPEDYAEAISAATGWSVTPEELLTVAERAWNLTRLFNVREGFTRKDDTLPERLFKMASTRGPSKGRVVDRESFEKMLDEYYDLVGWDNRTGIPKERKLSELGIEIEAQ